MDKKTCLKEFKVRKKLLFKFNAQKKFWVIEGNRPCNSDYQPDAYGVPTAELRYRDSLEDPSHW